MKLTAIFWTKTNEHKAKKNQSLLSVTVKECRLVQSLPLRGERMYDFFRQI